MLSTEAATQLRPDEAGPDDRRRPRARGRLRVDGAGVAGRDAGGGGRGHLQHHLHRLLRHQPGAAGPIWNAFLAGDSSVEDLTSAAAGDHRPYPRGRLDHQDRGGVTSSVARDDDGSRRRLRAVGSPAEGSAPAQADVRLRQLHAGVPRSCPWRSFLVFVVWPFVQADLLRDDRLDGLPADFNFIGFDNFTSLWDDEHFTQGGAEQHPLAIVVPIVTIVDRLDVRHDDHDRRFEPRPPARDRNSSFYRVVSFFPYVVPAIVIGLIWSKLFDPAERPAQRRADRTRIEPVRQLRLAR